MSKKFNSERPDEGQTRTDKIDQETGQPIIEQQPPFSSNKHIDRVVKMELKGLISNEVAEAMKGEIKKRPDLFGPTILFSLFSRKKFDKDSHDDSFYGSQEGKDEALARKIINESGYDKETQQNLNRNVNSSSERRTNENGELEIKINKSDDPKVRLNIGKIEE